MIVDALWSVLEFILTPLISILPVLDVLEALPHPGVVGNALHSIDVYVPILTPMRWLMGIVKTASYFIPVALFVWLWRLIPGKAS